MLLSSNRHRKYEDVKSDLSPPSSKKLFQGGRHVFLILVPLHVAQQLLLSSFSVYACWEILLECPAPLCFVWRTWIASITAAFAFLDLKEKMWSCSDLAYSDTFIIQCHLCIKGFQAEPIFPSSECLKINTTWITQEILLFNCCNPGSVIYQLSNPLWDKRSFQVAQDLNVAWRLSSLWWKHVFSTVQTIWTATPLTVLHWVNCSPFLVWFHHLNCKLLRPRLSLQSLCFPHTAASLALYARRPLCEHHNYGKQSLQWKLSPWCFPRKGIKIWWFPERKHSAIFNFSSHVHSILAGFLSNKVHKTA